MGHAKLNIVQRYAHPQEQHKADAMKKLALANAAKEIGGVREAEGPQKPTQRKTLPLVNHS